MDRYHPAAQTHFVGRFPRRCFVQPGLVHLLMTRFPAQTGPGSDFAVLRRIPDPDPDPGITAAAVAVAAVLLLVVC